MENNKDKCKYETHIFKIDENGKVSATIEFKEFNNMETKETTFLDRLISEEKELNIKVEKLYEFITTPGSEEKVGEDQYGLLLVQYSAMKAYRDVLLIRIHKLKQ